MSAANEWARARQWFEARGWTPWAFQEEAWALARDQDGLIHVPTGAGKTLAATLATLVDIAAHGETGLQLLYVTPLRAVARDVARALEELKQELGWTFAIESRLGDTASSVKARQRRRLPEVLITTPESWTLLLSHEDAERRFATPRTLVLDEWHELLGTKRGTQVELAAARTRRFAKGMRTWAATATVANPEEAARVACGSGSKPRIVRSELARPIEIRSVLPPSIEAFPWAGHLGLRLLDDVILELDRSGATIVFVNTRSQAESWYRALQEARPDWGDRLGLHHGSLDREERERVEAGLASGELQIVVSTSSLDLGVDLAPVDTVLQIGSVKGIARLLQRAGRSAHRPGATSRLVFVPTHALELLEIAALRRSLELGEIEERRPLHKPFDVLSQHLVTCALGGGFEMRSLLGELRSTVAYEDLGEDELAWVIELVEKGGRTLGAYPEYRKIERREDGVYGIATERAARQHRMNIGTITSDQAIEVRLQNGRALGSIEETFLARLTPGQAFQFAGQTLQMKQLRDGRAVVRVARSPRSIVPRWMGGKLPISSELGRAVRRSLSRPEAGLEMDSVRSVLEAQRRLSKVPTEDELLVEICRTSEGQHAFLYPFEGIRVHEGLALLLATRLSRLAPATFSLAFNDYGFELLTASDVDWREWITPERLAMDRLDEDLLDGVHLSEMVRRRFREVARVAGLVPQNLPGLRRTARQLQASAGLIYDVFERYDPANLLVAQARREVLEEQLERSRLVATLSRLQLARWVLVEPVRLTPLAFPLVVERLRSRVSSESLLDRIARLEKREQRAECASS